MILCRNPRARLAKQGRSQWGRMEADEHHGEKSNRSKLAYIITEADYIYDAAGSAGVEPGMIRLVTRDPGLRRGRKPNGRVVGVGRRSRVRMSECGRSAGYRSVDSARYEGRPGRLGGWCSELDDVACGIDSPNGRNRIPCRGRGRRVRGAAARAGCIRYRGQKKRWRYRRKEFRARENIRIFEQGAT